MLSPNQSTTEIVFRKVNNIYFPLSNSLPLVLYLVSYLKYVSHLHPEDYGSLEMRIQGKMRQLLG